MLTLSRSAHEGITFIVEAPLQVGDKIKLVVTKTSRGRVSLGIDAPQQVRIVRSELQPLDGKKGDAA